MRAAWRQRDEEQKGEGGDGGGPGQQSISISRASAGDMFPPMSRKTVGKMEQTLN